MATTLWKSRRRRPERPSEHILLSHETQPRPVISGPCVGVRCALRVRVEDGANGPGGAMEHTAPTTCTESICTHVARRLRAASGDGEAAAGARLYRLVWSSQCGCVLY